MRKHALSALAALALVTASAGAARAADKLRLERMDLKGSPTIKRIRFLVKVLCASLRLCGEQEVLANMTKEFQTLQSNSSPQTFFAASAKRA